MVDLIFVTNFFNAEKLINGIEKVKLSGNKYIHFLITPVEEIWIYERLFIEIVMVIVKDSTKVQYKRNNIIIKLV